MKNAAMVKLPEEKAENDGRSCIHNRVVQYLREQSIGFRPFQKNEMDAFMTTVGSTLWQLDGSWHKFHTASNVQALPESLHFVPEGRDSYRILHHGNHKKKCTPQIKSDELLVNYERLELLTTKRYLQAEDWKPVLRDIQQLKDSIGDYLRHVFRACDVKSAPSCDLEKVDVENRVLKVVLPVHQRDESVKLRYKDLEKRLLDVPTYTELNMIFVTPIERRMKHKYIIRLQLGFAVHLYRTYSPNATFVWRIDLSDSDVNSALVVARIEKNLFERVMADKLKKLEETFGGTANWTESKVLELVSAAQEDDSPPNGATQAGYKLLLDEGYGVSEAVELEKDAVACSTGKFSNFWDSVSKVLAADDLTVAEERRHGETSWISPLCVSLSDLMRKCEVEMERSFPNSPMNFIPSYEYFRLQFVPRNSHTEVSKRYYGRFDVKFGLQKRTLHKSHVDQHFGAKQFQFLKAMAGKFCDHSLAFFMDDKATIPVGFVGAPVSATRRQRSVLMAGLDGRGLNAMDHDNIPQHIVPSVSIKIVPPKELTDSWYCGKPIIIAE
ncbi:uncharacterized protein LOC6049162 [Culex quinquefasciatus]|uniref:uncharacterized protein LOC6049162 n=1 Tax=Culex quinquefasciatus TaxID=7176 RepID=UPI0018E3DA9C|nr:uncharacterized protein LOC6049162 [Culex quinquefasciatus]